MDLYEIPQAAQLAMALEASAYPKPGNIHRTADFKDTKYEHFLAAAIAAGQAFFKAAERGKKVALAEISLSEIGVGELVLEAVKQSMQAHRGSNTSLGTFLLLIPLTASASKTLVEEGNLSPDLIRKRFTQIIQATTPIDTVRVYQAITKAQLGGLGTVEKLDVSDEKSINEIKRKKRNILAVMRLAADRDLIARELTTNMEISFEEGYPTLKKIFEQTNDINAAAVQTYLTLLAKYPDTFIARKTTQEQAEKVSRKAAEALGKGGILTESGRKALWKLDEELHDPENKLNPGATADITAASLMIGLLSGIRP